LQENGHLYEDFIKEITKVLPKEVSAFLTKPYKGGEKTKKVNSKSTPK
jgi:hypothetical protein